MDQAEQFRFAYGLQSGRLRETQRNLIDEEFEEFCYAHRKETDADVLKELADLVAMFVFNMLLTRTGT